MPHSLQQIKSWIVTVLKELDNQSTPQPHLESVLSVLSTVGAALCLRDSVEEHRISGDEYRANATGIKLKLGFPEGLHGRNADLKSMINQAMSYFRIDLIDMGGRNANWKLKVGAQFLEEALMPLCRLLEAHPCLVHEGPILINIGCGPLLVPFFTPIVIAGHRRKGKAGSDFETKITAELPDSLVAKVKRGELDLIVTSFGKDFEGGSKVKYEYEDLKMHLCVARRSRVTFGDKKSLNLSEFKSIVAGKRVVMMTRNRSPALCPLTNVFPESTRHESFNSWIEIIGMGLAGNDTFCLAYPQIFGPEDRAKFRSIPLDADEFPKLRLGVAYHLEAGSNSERQVVLAGLFDAFANKIKVAREDESLHELGSRFPATLMRTAHVTHDPEGKAVWIHGRLQNRVVTSDGYLRADHEFQLPWQTPKPTINLEISGHMAVNEKGVHLTWRGYDAAASWTDSPESYVASFSVALTAFKDKHFVVGLWNGRASWNNHSDAPDKGYIVLLDENEELTDEELSNRVKRTQQIYNLGAAPEIPEPMDSMTSRPKRPPR